MTHVTVTRATFTFSGALAVLAVAFGCLANRPPATTPPAAPAASTAPHPGEELFAAYCTGCHTIDEAIAFVRARPDAVTARRDLTTLLASHADTTADQDTAIVDYLVSRK